MKMKSGQFSCSVRGRTVAVVAILFFVLVASKSFAAPVEVMQIGVFAERPKPTIQKQWQPIVDYLQSAMGGAGGGTRLELRILNSDELEESVQTKELEFIFVMPSQYLQLRDPNKLSGALATVVRRESGETASQFGGVIVVDGTRSTIEAQADLRGKRIAVPGTEFTGGFEAQAYELQKTGIDVFRDSRLIRVDSHDAVFTALLEGKADAGFARTGILEALILEGRLPPDRFRVVNPRSHQGFPFKVSTDLYPDWPFVALPHVSTRTVRRLTSALFTLEPDHPAAIAAGIAGFHPPADYIPVEDLLRSLRLPPYDRPPEIQWRDLWMVHAPWVLAAVVSLILFGVIAAWMATLHRRSRSEATLQESLSRRLKDILEGTNVGTWEWNVQTGQRFFNERWAGIVGYTLKELEAHAAESWTTLTHHEDLPRSRELLRQHFAGQTAYYECEVRMRHKDGHWVWVLDRGRVSSWTKDGKPLLMSGTHQDISERKLSEERLQLSERMFVGAFENAPIGLALVGPDGRWLKVNHALCTLIGYPKDELLTLTFQDITHPDDLTTDLSYVNDMLEGKIQTYQMEKRYFHKGGNIVWILLSVSMVSDAAGKPLYFISQIQNISERKIFEEQLREATIQAQAANVAKSRFLATMSHEIRTPMNGILGMAQLLLSESVSEKDRREYALTIHKSGQTLLTLLNDILDLSKVEAGELNLEEGIIEPRQIMSDARSLFFESAQEKGLDVSLEWSGPESPRYKGDSHRLSQMLTNLISNAIKFTAEGRVDIRSREVKRLNNSATLEFSVQDTGIGISEDKMDLLFKPFSQAHSSTSRQFGGTGLGLSIVRSLAKLMHGDVGVESKPGAGSRFWFTVDVEVLPGSSSRVHAADDRSVYGTGKTTFLGGHVLVVEDVLTNQIVITRFLHGAGVSTSVVENGQEALDFFERKQGEVDIILMDLQMPVLDGYQATHQIRAWERENKWDRTPIVALTAAAFPEDRERCLSIGMDDFLTKPIAASDLFKVLGRWLKQSTPDASRDAGRREDARSGFKAKIEELIPLLEQGRFDAIQVFGELEDLAEGTAMADRLADLHSALQEFRFDLVRNGLVDISERMDSKDVDQGHAL